MEEYTTCPFCGAERNSMDDVKCPECKRIYPDKEERLMGMRAADVAAFVEKKQERYMPIFKKNEGKKKFTSWNWAAALVPAEWMFYRKMYRQGAMYILITNVVSIVLSILLVFGFSGTLSQLDQAAKDYEHNRTIALQIQQSGGRDYYLNDTYREAVKGMSEAEDIILKAASIISGVSLITSLVVSIGTMIVTGLYGDCIYYHHVRKNGTNLREGGTSIAGMIGALILAGIVTSMVETVVEFFVTIIF